MSRGGTLLCAPAPEAAQAALLSLRWAIVLADDVLALWGELVEAMWEAQT